MGFDTWTSCTVSLHSPESIKKKSLHIYFNKNRHNMALSVRMGHGREKVISAYDFISLRRENLSNVWLWVQIDSNKYWQLKQININAMQNVEIMYNVHSIQFTYTSCRLFYKSLFPTT
jgi:hypothetical protein